jgi:ankyrin repeat protein
LVYVCGCLPGRIRQALADLPETLDETYQRTLREISKAHWELAYRLLQCVAVASRPLRVEELAEFLAFDFKAGSIPKIHENWRLEDPVDAVLSTCSSLLAVVNVEGSPTVQFSHFSVKEFLTSTRLAGSSDTISRRYHISVIPAHTLVAQACLGILLHLDGNVTRDDLKKFPLAEYAAKYWVDHARFENVSHHVEDGMKRLFHPGKPHLAVCVWIHSPAARRKTQSERPLPCPGNFLHYAAFWGLHAIIEFLVIEQSQSVHSQDFFDQATPLHLASRQGHVEAVRVLLKLGADVKAQNKYGLTPLHLTSQVKVAHMLLERGANAVAQNDSGWTPLHMVSRRGHAEVAHILLKYDADVSTQANLGLTPLLLASRRGTVEVTRMLLERGADVKAQEEDFSTPLHLASLRGHGEVVRILLAHGADVSAQNNLGLTPLHLASRSGNVKVARILLECDANVAAQDKDGSTALLMALKWRRAAVASMLLVRGADTEAQDNDASTPLHLASLQGHAEVVRMLLERDADAKAQNKHGLTPLDLALQGQHAKVVGILREYGMDAISQDQQE